MFPNINVPPLHGYSAALLVHAGGQPLPLLGVFNWHYLQCVIWFGTQQYKGLFNINFFVHPFRTASDGSDDESSDDFNVNPPYPSYHVDQYFGQQSENYQALKRHREVLQWASGISSSVLTQNPDERT